MLASRAQVGQSGQVKAWQIAKLGYLLGAFFRERAEFIPAKTERCISASETRG